MQLQKTVTKFYISSLVLKTRKKAMIISKIIKNDVERFRKREVSRVSNQKAPRANLFSFTKSAKCQQNQQVAAKLGDSRPQKIHSITFQISTEIGKGIGDITGSV